MNEEKIEKKLAELDAVRTRFENSKWFWPSMFGAIAFGIVFYVAAAFVAIHFAHKFW